MFGSVAAVTAYNTGLKYYTVAVTASDATSYTLTATRKGDLANDPKCGDFTLAMNAGVLTKGVSTGDVSYCWRQ
jgi:Tfp pilus assembly protein PilE